MILLSFSPGEFKVYDILYSILLLLFQGAGWRGRTVSTTLSSPILAIPRKPRSGSFGLCGPILQMLLGEVLEFACTSLKGQLCSSLFHLSIIFIDNKIAFSDCLLCAKCLIVNIKHKYIYMKY